MDRNIYDDFKSFARSKNWKLEEIAHSGGDNYWIISMRNKDGSYGQRNSHMMVSFFLVTFYEETGHVYTGKQIDALRKKYKDPFGRNSVW